MWTDCYNLRNSRRESEKASRDRVHMKGFSIKGMNSKRGRESGRGASGGRNYEGEEEKRGRRSGLTFYKRLGAPAVADDVRTLSR